MIEFHQIKVFISFTPLKEMNQRKGGRKRQPQPVCPPATYGLIGATKQSEVRTFSGSPAHEFTTGRASDWKVYLCIQCATIEQAIYVESHIKKMKSRLYIENLKKYPELIEKIIVDFNKKIKSGD